MADRALAMQSRVRSLLTKVLSLLLISRMDRMFTTKMDTRIGRIMGVNPTEALGGWFTIDDFIMLMFIIFVCSALRMANVKFPCLLSTILLSL